MTIILGDSLILCNGEISPYYNFINNILKNIIVGTVAFSAVGITAYLVVRHDQEVLGSIGRGASNLDTSAFRPTPEELKIARDLDDSILPQLEKLGLIKTISRSNLETTISVDGPVWKKRSSFFKESLIDQLFVYNKVKGISVRTKIIDDSTQQIYAQIIPPDRREVLE